MRTTHSRGMRVDEKITFTLGAGFLGGEVTPLFFIGATLGIALVAFVQLPLALLAALLAWVHSRLLVLVLAPPLH